MEPTNELEFYNLEIKHYRDRQLRVTIGAITLNVLIISFLLLKQPEINVSFRVILAIILFLINLQVISVIIISRERGYEIKKLRRAFLIKSGILDENSNSGRDFGFSYLQSVALSYILTISLIALTNVVLLILPLASKYKRHHNSIVKHIPLVKQHSRETAGCKLGYLL